MENITNNHGEQESDHERIRIERRFNEMNRQIGELSLLVRTLTEKISSGNREQNGNN